MTDSWLNDGDLVSLYLEIINWMMKEFAGLRPIANNKLSGLSDERIRRPQQQPFCKKPWNVYIQSSISLDWRWTPLHLTAYNYLYLKLEDRKVIQLQVSNTSYGWRTGQQICY